MSRGQPVTPVPGTLRAISHNLLDMPLPLTYAESKLDRSPGNENGVRVSARFRPLEKPCRVYLIILQGIPERGETIPRSDVEIGPHFHKNARTRHIVPPGCQHQGCLPPLVRCIEVCALVEQASDGISSAGVNRTHESCHAI